MKKYINILPLLFTLLLLQACSSSDDGTKIYIPQAGTLVNVKFDIKDKPFEQPFNVALTIEEYPAPANVGVSQDVKVLLEADLSKVEGYNKENGKSYKALPEGCFTFAKEAIIKKGESQSESTILFIDAKDKVTAFEYYLLPISISGVEGASADNCHQTVYFLIYPSLDASDMDLFDRQLWTVVEVSSEELNGEGANNGAAKYILDGKGSTFWHTQWQGGEPSPPHHIVIDMGEEKLMQGFGYLTRDIGQSWPKDCIIEVSKDGTTWEVAGNFTGLVAEGATEYRSFFPTAKEARYFKMTITVIYGSASTHIAEIYGF